MAKLKYVKVRGSVSIDKKAHKTTSIADAQYRVLHDAAYKKIQKKHSEYALSEVRAANIKISSDSLLGQVNSEIRGIIEKLKEIGAKAKIPEKFGGINIYEQIIPACLIVAEQPEPSVQKIVQKDDGTWVTQKASNILKTTFNVSRMLQISFQLLVMGKGITDNDVFNIVESIYVLFSNFYELSEIKLDDCSVKVLLALYELSSPGLLVDEEQLLDKVQKRYPEINKKQFYDSVNKLSDYSCIRIENGNLFIVETM